MAGQWTWETLKKHLRIEHDDEDELLRTLFESAVAHVKAYMGDDIPAEPQQWSLVAQLATLQIAASWYLIRESVSVTEYSDVTTAGLKLLDQYRGQW